MNLSLAELGEIWGKHKRKYGFRRIERYAAIMRHNTTSGENLLWEIIKDAKSQLPKFIMVNRQKRLGYHIADFFIPEFQLAIEVDGTSHIGREYADNRRDQWLSAHGITTIRIPDWQVFQTPDKVHERIFGILSKEIEKRKKRDVPECHFLNKP